LDMMALSKDLVIPGHRDSDAPGMTSR